MNLSPLPLAVFVVDATGTITSWNRACEKLAGYGAADIRNRSLDKIIAFDTPATRRATLSARTGTAYRCG